MKITKENLLLALAPASHVIAQRSSLPILGCVKLEAKNNILTVCASDGNQYSRSTAECEGDIPAICVRFAALQNLVPILGDSVTMEVKAGKLLIRSHGSFVLNTEKTDEFPAEPVAKLVKIGVNCADLAESIDRVKFASRKDDSRLNLYGVNVRLMPKFITCEASTGLIMARVSKPAICAESELMVPFPFVGNVIRALLSDGAVLSVSETRMAVSFDQGSYSCGLSACKMPKIAENNLKGKKIGQITPTDWLPVLKTVAGMRLDGDLCCPILVENGRLKHESAQGSVDSRVDKLSHRLKLNALTFADCLQAFKDGPCDVLLAENTNLILTQGELTVLISQLRG